jgi:hypothetical protein
LVIIVANSKCQLISVGVGPDLLGQIPYTAHHSTLAKYVGVLWVVGDAVGSLSVIAVILLRFK